MNPRLAAVAGPLKGSTFLLKDEDVLVGRESSNQICLADPSVSRRHCVIKKEDGQYKIVDLDSLNSTFVNDVPIKERVLKHGDRIRVGDSTLLFHLHEGEVQPATGQVRFDERQIATGATVEVRMADAIYLMARDLSALMKISTQINSIRDLGELQRRLLELIFEVVPAEHGAILLADGQEGDEFASVFGLDRAAGSDAPVRVSRTISRKVLNEGVAILSNDVSDKEDFDAESVISTEIHSLLCVPVTVYEKALGVIYLYTTDPHERFDQDQLQLVTAISNIAAVALENARHVEWLESENERLREDIQIEHNMVGESARMREVYQFIAKVAPTISTVLIWGESGTGKELAARAIHQNSPRADHPFVALNCAALTETLLESGLFGHEKGAFTGAISQTKGKLEVADGGTVFLDEIGELAAPLQAKLLRVLQEREFERVGSTRPIKVDIRLVAATNRDLAEAAKQGSFRQDLYYRLNVVSFHMPGLRERREDIPLLASYFVKKYAEKCNRRALGISQEARARLMQYDWPGNVRELENAIERAVVLGSSERI